MSPGQIKFVIPLRQLSRRPEVIFCGLTIRAEVRTKDTDLRVSLSGSPTLSLQLRSVCPEPRTSWKNSSHPFCAPIISPSFVFLYFIPFPGLSKQHFVPVGKKLIFNCPISTLIIQRKDYARNVPVYTIHSTPFSSCRINHFWVC